MSSLHLCLCELNSPTPTQLPCFFAREIQQIEKAAWVLDVLEYIPNIGPAREKWVDGGNKFAIIHKSSLTGFSVAATACSPGADSCNIAAPFAFLAAHAE